MWIFLFRYRLSLTFTLLLLVLSLLPIPETPLERIHWADKYTHFLMYGSYALALWSETTSKGSRRLLSCLLWPIVWGGVLEIAQSTLTTTRSGDWIDLVANAIGVLLALPLGLYFHRRFSSLHS